MNDRPYLIVSVLVFLFVAVMHLLRLTLGWAAQVGTMTFPLWGSMLAIVIFAGFAIWGLSLLRHKH